MKLFKIIWCLLLVHEEKPTDAIAGLLNISSRTVYNWTGQFLLGSFSWLLGLRYQGRGRKPRLNEEQKSRLYEIIIKDPEKYGFDCGIWNSAMIVEVIQKDDMFLGSVQNVPKQIRICLRGEATNFNFVEETPREIVNQAEVFVTFTDS